MKIEISNDIDDVVEFLDELKLRALVNAARKSMNRSVMALRTQANRVVREERKLKMGEINKDYFKVTKAKGSDLGSMSASLSVSGKSVSLIRFLVGNKSVQSTKGIPVKQRTPVRVEVRPGRKVTLKGAFLAAGKSGNVHIFRRRTAARHPIVKQSTPALSVLLARDQHRLKLESFAKEHFSKEFKTTFSYEVQRLIDKKNGKAIPK